LHEGRCMGAVRLPCTSRPECEPRQKGRGIAAIERIITGFHQDAQGHWLAVLSCGHTQEVRHDPPRQIQPGILTADSRQAHVGTALPCRQCDLTATGRPSPYEDARLCGLCEDGAVEIQDRPPRSTE